MALRITIFRVFLATFLGIFLYSSLRKSSSSVPDGSKNPSPHLHHLGPEPRDVLAPSIVATFPVLPGKMVYLSPAYQVLEGSK